MLDRKPVRIVLGIFFLLLAVVGALLPFLQGWVFLALALLVLSPDIPLFQKWLCKVEKRFPSVRKPLAPWKRRLFKGRDMPQCPES